MGNAQTYRFTAELKRFRGKGAYYYADFPYDVYSEFGERKAVRVIVELNGKEYRQALVPHGDGSHYVILSRAKRKTCGVTLGEKIALTVRNDPNPDTLDIPEELQAVFELEPLAHERFEKKLTLGTKRGICHWVGSARREETRTKRALDMMNRLLSDSFDMGGRQIPMN